MHGRTHRCVLIERSSPSRPASDSTGYCFVLPCSFDRLLLDVPPQRAHIERPRQAESPWERPTTLGEVETTRVTVQRGTPTGKPAAGIGDTSALDHHDAQQVALGRANTATHTSSLWAHSPVRPTRHR